MSRFGSWLAEQEWTTNQELTLLIDSTVDHDYNSKVSVPGSKFDPLPCDEVQQVCEGDLLCRDLVDRLRVEVQGLQPLHQSLVGLNLNKISFIIPVL